MSILKHKQNVVNNIYSGKGNIKSSLCLFKHYTIKICGKVEVCLHVFSTLAPDGGEWSELHTSALGKGPLVLIE
jgi:hypothetical protein